MATKCACSSESRPGFWTEEGLIHRETLLIDPALLAALARDHILAIATGRPLAEADFPLDRFDLRKYFRTVITLDDSIKEEERIFRESGTRVSLKKPDPYSDLHILRAGLFPH